MMNNIRQLINLIKGKGFFHIIISSSLVKIISFLSAMFLPRLLSKSDYGVLVYVDNIRNYVLLFNALGITNATLRFCTQEDNEAKKRGDFIYSIKCGLFIDIILVLFTVAVFFLCDFQYENSKILLLATSILPILMFLYEDLQLYLRARFANKEFSILSFLYAVLMVVSQICFAAISGLKGIVAGRYLAVGISILVGTMLVYSFEDKNMQYIYPSKEKRIRMLKFGIVMMFTNMTSYIMQLNETSILSWVLNDEEKLATYRVAGYILTVSLFIMQSVTVFVFPYFVKHKEDKEWIWEKFKKITILNFVIMLFIHILLMILAPLIVYVLYGLEYMDAVPVMRLLLVASFGQAVFRMLPGNILTGIGEEKFNLRINIISMVAHLILGVFFVRKYGLYGSAIALTIIYYVTGIIMILYLKKICKSGNKSQII